jgi:hypothetical protein
MCPMVWCKQLETLDFVVCVGIESSIFVCPINMPWNILVVGTGTKNFEKIPVSLSGV